MNTTKNYDFEMRELTEDIKALELARTEKQSRLNTLLKKKNAPINEAKDSIIRDHIRKPIKIGDWVMMLTKGKYKTTEGQVVSIKKWVIFLDSAGVKQFRAHNNLIISKYVGKHTKCRNARPTRGSNGYS